MEILINQLRSAIQALGQIYHNLSKHLMTIIMLAIALMLPNLLWLANNNFGCFFNKFLQPNYEVLAFFENNKQNDITENYNFLNQLQTKYHNNLLSINHIDPKQAINNLDSINFNQLPQGFILKLKPNDTAKTNDLIISTLKKHSNLIEIIEDSSWQKKLISWSSIIKIIISTTSILLITASIIVINNSINFLISQQQKYIEIVTLIGATKGFILKNFIYLSIWYAFIATAISSTITSIIFFITLPTLKNLSDSYALTINWQLNFSNLFVKTLLITLSIALSITYLVVNKYISKLEINYDK